MALTVAVMDACAEDGVYPRLVEMEADERGRKKIDSALMIHQNPNPRGLG